MILLVLVFCVYLAFLSSEIKLSLVVVLTVSTVLIIILPNTNPGKKTNEGIALDLIKYSYPTINTIVDINYFNFTIKVLFIVKHQTNTTVRATQ